jgi:hypothetical protein
LHLVGVDKAGEVRVGHHRTREFVSLLLCRLTVDRAKDLIESGESSLCPDDETSDVTTGGKLEQIQTANLAQFHAGKVAEGTGDTVVVLVHDERTLAHHVTAATGLTNTTTELLGVNDLLHIGVGTTLLQGLDSLLGLLKRLDRVVKDAGDLSNVLDTVTAGGDEGRKGGGSKSGSSGVTTLVHINLAVPLAPGLEVGEHATSTAHVTEGTLTSGGRSTTRDTGDTRDGTTGTP